ncbi:VCBS repeat-containing protein [Peterkaempfera bronchialis]|uniref:VCBS repeat-containing protein n=1 Tax=Peterkaempfera bronchialis TaxID=2126346 RepID=UPI003C306536
MTGEPVEVLAERTETSTVYANPSGTFTEERHVVPVRVVQDHRFVDVDTDLAVQTDGSIAPKAAAVGITFSGGGSTPLVSIQRDGRSMSLSWPGTLPEPSIKGDVASYADVLPDVDLQLKATVDGYQQLLVVKTAEAAKNPALSAIHYGLKADGVEVSTDAHGNLKAVNPAGQEVFTGPTPRMWDSSGNPIQQDIATDTGVRALRSPAAGDAAPAPGDAFDPGPGAKDAAMKTEVTDTTLKITPDRSLLTDPDTRYPVYIDPAVAGKKQAWTRVYRKYPDTSFWGDDTVARVGYENETNGLSRSFFLMDTSKFQGTDRQVISSNFRIKNTWSWSCTKRPVELWWTGKISSASTWNKQPSWTQKLDTVNGAKGWSGDCPAGNLEFDTTGIAKTALSNKASSITLGLRATDESDTYAWKKFDASSAVFSTEYNSIPNAPTNPDTYPVSTRNSAGCGDTAPYGLIGNTDVFLTAKVSDPDGGAVKARFNLWATGHHDDGPKVFFDKTVAVTSGTLAKVQVPVADLKKYLPNGNSNFSWKVQALDDTSTSDWTPAQGAAACRFVYDPNRPSNPPGVSSPQFPNGDAGWPQITGTVRSASSFTFTSGGVSDVAKYEYWTDWAGTHTTVNAPTPGGSYTLNYTSTNGPQTAGPHRMYVKSLDKAGNSSDTATYLFYVNGLAVKDKPGDLNGDGNADLWALSASGDLHRYYGDGTGKVVEASSLAAYPGDLKNAQITHRGDWNNDAFEDLLVRHYDSVSKTYKITVWPNNGTGYACQTCDEGTTADDKFDLQLYTTMDDDGNETDGDNHWQSASQILAIGDVDGGIDGDGDGKYDDVNAGDVPSRPDLLVRSGNQLWLYYQGPLGYMNDTPPVLVGNGGWSEYDLIAPGDRNGDGRVDLIARKRSTGELFEYDGTGPNGEGLGSGSLRKLTGTGFTPANYPLLTSPPDANNSGKPDIWVTDASGSLWFYPDDTNTTSGFGTRSNVGSGFTGFASLG